MRRCLAAQALAIAILITITNALQCNFTRNDHRYVSEDGKAKNITLYWASDPARAASALLAYIIRYKLGYHPVYLQEGPHNLAELAASVKHSSSLQYDEVIIAVSTAWYPSRAPHWEPKKGSWSGLAGPRLEEYGASTVPARERLHVYLPDEYKVLPDCEKANRWDFYTNVTALKYCGFMDAGLSGENAIVYGLGLNNHTMIELETRAKASRQLLQFQKIDRKTFYERLRAKRAFLFIDYDIWLGYKEKYVRAVQPPPCILVNATCQQELDTAIAMRVADVYLLQEYAPELYQAIHKFAPSVQALRVILELENDKYNIETAAAEWVTKNNNTIYEWIEEYKPSEKEYEIAVFIYNEPDDEYYTRLVKSMAESIVQLYQLSFRISLRRYIKNCSDISNIKNEIDYYLKNGHGQSLLGAVVGGVANMTDIAKTVSGFNMPVLLYDAVGVEADSTKSVWLTTGSSLHLAFALKHFIVSNKWTRIAVISELTPSAEDLVANLRDVIKEKNEFAFQDHKVNFDLTESAALTVLNNLNTENARIILVNTNYKDSITILSAAIKLKMNDAKEYAWIVRDWRPNNATLNIRHFMISFRCWSMDCVTGTEEFKENFKLQSYDTNNLLPAQSVALIDSVLALVSGFNFTFQNFLQARDDVHSAQALCYFGRGLVESPVDGPAQKLQFQGRALAEPFIYLDRWHGDQMEHLAIWTVNAKTSYVDIVSEIKPVCEKKNQIPHDGTASCIWVSDRKAYLPSCYDSIWITALVILILFPPVITLLYRFISNWLKDKELKIRNEAITQRYQRVAAISPSYLVNRSTLEFSDELGLGRFGCVTRAKLRIPGHASQCVAAKALRGDQDESEILHEATILTSLEHDNIIRLVGVVIDKDPPLILMEVAFFGDLLEYLQKRRYLAEVPVTNIAELGSNEESDYVSPKALTRLARQAASALVYLSLKGIVHRDVRASNCLVDETRSLKLADFGMARKTTPSSTDGTSMYTCRTRGVFPVLWMAPESLADGDFTSASDIWAFGVLVYELVTLGDRPYGDMSPPSVREFVTTGGKPPMPRDASPHTINLTRLCWRRKAAQRLTATEVETYLLERPYALCPALDYDHDEPSEIDSGYGETPTSGLLE